MGNQSAPPYSFVSSAFSTIVFVRKNYKALTLDSLPFAYRTETSNSSCTLQILFMFRARVDEMQEELLGRPDLILCAWTRKVGLSQIF